MKKSDFVPIHFNFRGFTSKIKQSFSENTIFFLVLFVLLALRAPKDLFTPYLWAEDGAVIIQGAIYDGVKAIFTPGNGAYWVIQKALGVLCYWAVLPTNSIAALPYLLQIVSKMLTVFSIMYFMSDRFQWLVPKKIYRFAICIGIVLLIPQHASDLVTCDTSLPFALFFTAFLISLDLLCSGKYEMLSRWQTVFFVLLSLSIASAPCIAAIAITVFAQWLFMQIKSKTVDRKQIFWAVLKLLAVLLAVLIQTQQVLSSGRVNADLDMLNRILLNTKSFIFFPYWNQLHSWTAFFIGLACWLNLCYFAKLPWKVPVYCGAFSFLYMLYCSMVGSPEEFYSGLMTGRFVVTSFEISALMIGLAITRLWDSRRKINRNIGYVLLAGIMVLSLKTYNIEVIGSASAESYKMHNGVFAVNGSDHAFISIGPWHPWIMRIPADISTKPMEDDLEIGIEVIDGIFVHNENFAHIRSDSYHSASGWVRTSTPNQTLQKLFVKLGNQYVAAEKITIRDNFQNNALTHNGWEFYLHPDYFTDGSTTLEIVGETADGKWHRGFISFSTTLVSP